MSFLSKFFERSKSVSLDGLTDWHSHILPGVDDGVETLEESLEILAGYEELGIRQVWLTPHIMEDLPNTPAKLRARFEQLCQAYSGPLKLHLAAENMIDNLFLQRLEADDLLP
ncbi:MAG: capsular biosynthesis protein, partial [Muribaculaceae bacterium]|nr:capsular biosynthesis protein [Muribaculaceae bacterium]